MRMTVKTDKLTDDVRAALIRARLAPTMAEATRVYLAALATVPAASR